ncbi:uncharacterized protein PHACADRAFT_202642 [Phanerochaete carnosa HHB-10118-sp]|uniref:Uncharacterized protein n=1 Tax=Phanerochaete carnosa (strain HHB-10118-sp) TaxID=650164 RepID=K5VPD1_PHACS|nr:uncharacterized protein PHACADRAFT_202642 [Phanerochaete carnosa HHB-10118-sp]EKM48580.1 hypothetical protein PHACADRAFT_202642 [Phanerochaete carnosa HHB-10118-sp]
MAENIPNTLIPPSRLVTYQVHKQLKLKRAWNIFTSSHLVFSRIRALPPAPASGHCQAISECFDSVLLVEHLKIFKNCSNGLLDSLRLAHVHVIFKLPPQYGIPLHSLLYVEWYMLFLQVDGISQLFQVSCSTQNC